MGRSRRRRARKARRIATRPEDAVRIKKQTPKSPRERMPKVYQKKWYESTGAWLLRVLIIAYLDARKGKRRSQSVREFEKDPLANLRILKREILAREYKPSRCKVFISNTPVRREIFAAAFRDRVVHRLLYNVSAGWWNRRLGFDCYACRPKKGALMGARRLQKFMARARQEYKEPVYIIKMDIEAYFTNLPREKLLGRVYWGLDRQFGKFYQKRVLSILKYLWKEVLMDSPAEGAIITRPEDYAEFPCEKSLFYQEAGKGIAIGNLTSQLVSNIYLDQLDRYVQFSLGYKYYGRYVDDFYILVPKSKLSKGLSDVSKIREYLATLGLKLHPRKLYIQDTEKGVNYLGARVYPNRILPGKRMNNNFKKAAWEVAMGEREASELSSYLGQMSHFRARKLEKKTFENLGWDYSF